MAQDKPTVSLNLDALERENAPKPFSVVLGGKRMVLLDAQEVDYRDLLALMTNPQDFFRLVVDPQHRQHVEDTKLPAWKLNRLVEAYLGHYGIRPGEPLASSTS